MFCPFQLVSCCFPTFSLSSGTAVMDQELLMEHSLLYASLPKVSKLGLLCPALTGNSNGRLGRDLRLL